MSRSGTILIIVAGICALLASLTLAFILRSRASIEETAAFEADVQARIMLIAACSYVCEASRIGYEPLVNDPANNGNHVEAYGWVDVRDGSAGPNTRNYRTNATSSLVSQELEILPLWGSNSGGAPTSTTSIPTGLPAPDNIRPNWPEIKSVARCPLFRMIRPPYALEMTVTYNDLSKTNDLTYLKNPDPRPLFPNDPAMYAAGDKTPIQQTLGRCWFRVYRDTPSTFVITVGAGGTEGFRDYREVVAAGAEYAAQFNYDALYFNTLLAQEFRMWYRIEWSPAVGGALNHNLLSSYSGWDTKYQFYTSSSGKFALHPMNTSHVTYPFTNQEGEIGSQSHPINQGGTIRWVQRLKSPPKLW